MILFVAPYSPPTAGGSGHLGATRKIEVIASVLAHLDNEILLVNSAHCSERPSPLSIRKITIGGVDVTEITPATSSNRAWGKLRNILFVKGIVRTIGDLGPPKFVWFYNGYAFEMQLCLLLERTFRVPMIMEFEDWHFSRRRGLNPKPLIDYCYWRLAAPRLSGVFVANSHLGTKMARFTNRVELLPGVVPQTLAKIAIQRPPFAVSRGPVRIGFFGGLSVEKGADLVLELANTLPEGFILHVTGTGPLAADFYARAKVAPRSLQYHGHVNDARLYELIAECDVILNPHSSIREMNDGVFPFKLIEAVASARLAISTQVPMLQLHDVLAGVQFVEHSSQAFHSAVLASREFHFAHADVIARSAALANQRFGEESLLASIRSMVGPTGLDT